MQQDLVTALYHWGKDAGCEWPLQLGCPFGLIGERPKQQASGEPANFILLLENLHFQGLRARSVWRFAKKWKLETDSKGYRNISFRSPPDVGDRCINLKPKIPKINRFTLQSTYSWGHEEVVTFFDALGSPFMNRRVRQRYKWIPFNRFYMKRKPAFV